MKKLFTFLSIALMAIGIKAQSVYIPDFNFKSYLLANSAINLNADTAITAAEAGSFSGEINITSAGITDFTGIEAFTSLTTLIIYLNNEASLNLSSNNALQTVDCNGSNITSLILPSTTTLTDLNCSNNLLTSLNLSGLLGLSNLNCGVNHLDSIDVSANAYLYVLNCYDNMLTSIDVSSNNFLGDLDCSGNSIASVNLANNTALTSFESRYTQLTTLDVTNNTALTFLSIEHNMISSIDISANTALTEIDFSHNQFLTLNISGHPLITNADVSFNPYMSALHFTNNIGMTSINLSGCIALQTLNCYFSRLNSLDLSVCPSLVNVQAYNIPTLTSINLAGCTNISALNLSNDNLSSIDLSPCTALFTVDLDNNHLNSIDVTNNSALQSLQFIHNSVTSLDITNNPAINYLDITYNHLLLLKINNGNDTNLIYFDCRNNPHLQCIQVDNTAYMNANWSTGKDATATYNTFCNPIVYIPDLAFKTYLLADTNINVNSDSEIQVSEAIAFTGGINVDALGISDLTGIEAFVNLTSLICINNNLTTIDISYNTMLITLKVYTNQLTALDVSQNTHISTLWCFANQITSLNVVNLTSLNQLDCKINGMTSLTLGTLPLLNYLVCLNNQLTNLNLTGCVNLNTLLCWNNLLTSLDVTANTMLTDLRFQNNINLTSVNMQGIIDANLAQFDATLCPSLTCIQVNNQAFMYTNWNSAKDIGASYNVDCAAPIVYIPDVAFKTILLADTLINTNQDTEIQYSEAWAYTGGISVNSAGIADMTGIEAFTALTNLNCMFNSFTSLNVSANTALTNLNCQFNSISSLDVTHNTALTGLAIRSNPINTLDITNNTQLVNFTSRSCPITSLNFSNCPNMQDIDVGGDALTSLNVSNCPLLTGLSCFGNSISVLDVSNNPLLASLDCQGGQFTSLDLSHNPMLYYVDVTYGILSSMNLKNGNNTHMGFGGLHATSVANLSCVQVDNVSYAIANWGASAPTAVFSTCCSSGMVSIPDANFEAYLLTNSSINTNLDSIISCSEASAYTGAINVAGLGIATLDGIASFTNITNLDCSNNSIATVNLTDNTALTSVTCANNNSITALNVTGLTSLITLYADHNLLTTLDVTTCTALTDLVVSQNNLTSLNTANNVALQYFYCSQNILSSLDVSTNTALLELLCDNNQLTALDVSFNLNITSLYCNNNLLTSLTVLNNVLLADLKCDFNLLTSLDVSANIALIYLYCSNNLLTNLDVSSNTSLLELFCYANQLTTLPVATNTSLSVLYCGDNQLLNLDVSANTMLTNLQCAVNMFTNLDLSVNTGLSNLICSFNPNLNSLNIQNSNNASLMAFDATNNPLLTCIQVDDTLYMNANWSGGKDGGATFSLNCGCVTVYDTINPVICFGANISVGINNYSVAGTYTDTLLNTMSCDSIVTTYLTVIMPDTVSQTINICNGASYSIGSSTYTVAGMYNDLLSAFSGCDSLVYTNLLVDSVFADAGAVLFPCQGDTISFAGGTNTGTTFFWNFDDGQTSSLLNVDHIFNTGGTFHVSFTANAPSGCSAIDTAMVYVSASTNIYGYVDSVGTPLTAGNVYLYPHPNGFFFLDTMAITTIDTNGYFIFPSVYNDNYLLQAVADGTTDFGMVPTYSGNAALWTSASLVTHGCITHDTINISMLYEDNSGSGPGFVSGYVVEGDSFMSRNQGEPVPGLDVKMGHNPGGGIAATTTTDTNGYYHFDNLDIGDYIIYVDIPGLGRDSSYHVSITASTLNYPHQDYVADSSWVYIDSLGLAYHVGLPDNQNDETKFTVYPNPFAENTTIEYSVIDDARVTLDLYNPLGIKINSLVNSRLQKGSYKYLLNTENGKLSAGVYFVSLTIGEKSYFKKVVVY